MANITKRELLDVASLNIDPITNELLDKLVKDYDYKCDMITWLQAVCLDLVRTNTPMDSKQLLDFLEGKVKFSIF